MMGDGARAALILARRPAAAEWAGEPRDPGSAAVAEIRDRIKTEPDPRSLSVIYTTAVCRRLLGPKAHCIPPLPAPKYSFQPNGISGARELTVSVLPPVGPRAYLSFMKSLKKKKENPTGF